MGIQLATSLSSLILVPLAMAATPARLGRHASGRIVPARVLLDIAVADSMQLWQRCDIVMCGRRRRRA